MSQTSPSSLSARGRYWILSIGIPAVLALALILAAWIWQDKLPNPIATHWSGETPDGFGSLWFMVLMIAATILGLGLFCYYAGRSSKNTNRLGAGAKMLGSISLWFSTMLAFGVGYSIYAQLGLSSAEEASDLGIGFGLLFSAALGFVVAVIGWFLIPKDHLLYHEEMQSVEAMKIGDADKVSMIEDLPAPQWMQILLAIISVVIVGVLWYSTDNFALTLSVGLLMLLTMVFLNWRVRINNSGLKIDTILGFPRFSFPIESMVKVGTEEVNPAGDFGGWGLRISLDNRKFGVVMRQGSALSIERKNKKRTFIVTMENAEKAASVLSGLLERNQRRIEQQADDTGDNGASSEAPNAS
ncbi:MAG: DUF1648 domain-containing protein [Microbacteriaceae bacterium]